jgi:hypothetical protein
MFEYKYPNLKLEIVQRTGKDMDRFDGTYGSDNGSNATTCEANPE